MGGRAKTTLALIAVAIAVAAAATFAGCGSSSSGGTSTAEAEPSAQFRVKGGGKEQTADFGSEASEAEREAASAVLEENLEARAKEDWAGQCASLAAPVVKVIKQNATFLPGKVTCARQLEQEASGVPKSYLADTLEGHIDAFRVKGNEGFALFHGSDGFDYAMEMTKEGGEWKVNSLTTIKMGKAKAAEGGKAKTAEA
jgi:hypothetical protein